MTLGGHADQRQGSGTQGTPNIFLTLQHELRGVDQAYIDYNLEP
jgi:hypothetical protein